eukprot:9481346-Pyramimonas_sp.AAC.1
MISSLPSFYTAGVHGSQRCWITLHTEGNVCRGKRSTLIPPGGLVVNCFAKAIFSMGIDILSQ